MSICRVWLRKHL